MVLLIIEKPIPPKTKIANTGKPVKVLPGPIKKNQNDERILFIEKNKTSKPIPPSTKISNVNIPIKKMIIDNLRKLKRTKNKPVFE